jgi:pyrroline-5-carboxylate reductase
VSSVLKGVGELVRVPEKEMDAVTALSGSGPAYVFYLAEGMIQAAQSVGIKKDLARSLVHQTLFGAGRMLKERPEEAAELRRQVTSPGGTTAAAIAEFEKRKFLESVISAIKKATARSKELARI